MSSNAIFSITEIATDHVMPPGSYASHHGLHNAQTSCGNCQSLIRSLRKCHWINNPASRCHARCQPNAQIPGVISFDAQHHPPVRFHRGRFPTRQILRAECARCFLPRKILVRRGRQHVKFLSVQGGMRGMRRRNSARGMTWFVGTPLTY